MSAIKRKIVKRTFDEEASKGLDGLLLHITGSSEGRLGLHERQTLIVLRDDDSALREFFANTIKPQIISIHDLSRDFIAYPNNNDSI